MLNRLIVLLVMLGIGAVAVAAAVLAWTIPEETIDFLRDGVNWLEEHNGTLEKSLLTAVAALIVVIALTVIGLELMPSGKSEVRITDLSIGEAVIPTSTVAKQIEDAVREGQHVTDAKAFVLPKGKGVEVQMDLHVDADANLAEVTDAASEAVQDVLSRRMHVAQTRPPRFRLHYRELRLGQAGTKGTPVSPRTTTAEARPVAATPAAPVVTEPAVPSEPAVARETALPASPPVMDTAAEPPVVVVPEDQTVVSEEPPEPVVEEPADENEKKNA